MNSGVYAIISPSGRRYIGSAVNFARRWATHRYELRNGTHHCAGLQKAFDKYGDALQFERLLICAPGDVLLYEQRAIDAYGLRNLYNAAPVAGNQSGLRHSAETRAEYSRKRKGMKLAPRRPEHSAAIGRAVAQRPVTAETRAKLSTLHKGAKRPPETGQKIAAALANRKGAANTSGYAGVSPHKQGWQARVRVDGKRKHLGYFDTIEAAAQAVRDALHNTLSRDKQQ